MHLSFDVSALQRGTSLAVAIVPLLLSDRAVFSAPSDEALTVTGSPAPGAATFQPVPPPASPSFVPPSRGGLLDLPTPEPLVSTPREPETEIISVPIVGPVRTSGSKTIGVAVLLGVAGAAWTWSRRLAAHRIRAIDAGVAA
jgi:hypothetical protein